jgi:hypothetical protein
MGRLCEDFVVFCSFLLKSHQRKNNLMVPETMIRLILDELWGSVPSGLQNYGKSPFFIDKW